MSEAIIVALITAAGAVVAQLIIAYRAKSIRDEEHRAFVTDLYAKLDRQSETADLKIQAKLENYQAVVNEKIDELSRRVEAHNRIVERTYNLEQKVAVHDEQIKVANHRVEDLERMGA